MRLCYVESKKPTAVITLHIARVLSGQLFCKPLKLGASNNNLVYIEGPEPTCKNCKKKLAEWIPEVRRVSAIVKEIYPELWDEADKRRIARVETGQQKQLEDGKEW